ncbi:MAG: DUF4093 domain-containing protein [Oscillibacter sp.]|jgi:ribonuclease M5|nr:DUF4093 domain-containing protein [Oscillibacter sp.]
MRKIREVIVVEGRYDKNAIRQAVDAAVLETGGFSIFNDREKLSLLRRLAGSRGLILLTDSDGAGFVIRGYLRGAIPAEQIKQAYIPNISGKERRKRAPGKAGLLGVEGMRPEVLLKALERAGATFEDEAAPSAVGAAEITKADLYELGLSGTEGSAERRRRLLRELELPEGLQANGLLDVLNALTTKEALARLAAGLDGKPGEGQ